MKLITITNRFNFIIIFLILIVSGFILFILIQYHLDQEINEQLHTEQVHISRAMVNLDSIRNPTMLLNDNLRISKINNSLSINPILFDTLIYDNVADEIIPYRAIRFSANTKMVNYDIRIIKSKVESSDLAFSIFTSLLPIILMVGLAMIIINYYFNKKLWSPFLNTITIMKKWNLNDRDTKFEVPETRIEEFAQLNHTLLLMIERIKKDYEKIKEFSENAAHEIQTPLAVISSKLESLLQSKNLNRESALLISQALENSIRLSKINQSLLLLTKISNRQFEDRKQIVFSTLITKCLENYNENIFEKKLSLEFIKDEEFVSSLHPVLAEILVSNLLNNSISHNKPNGSIRIALTESSMKIINTGEAPEIPIDHLFMRFRKGSHSTSHLGLGLAIIKEIVVTNQLKVSYVYEEPYHKIEISKAV